MRTRAITSGATALLVLLASVVVAKHEHLHLNALDKRHKAHRDLHKSIAETAEHGIELRSVGKNSLQKRGQCQFPSNAGLVAVSPNSQNAGWAMSPGQHCTSGNYCPYACPSGQLSAQWDPSATSYTYPQSMNGGLYCDNNGNIQKPFPNKPYCVQGTGAVGVQNNANGVVSFCQTVLPGNEAMLIPTSIENWEQLAVPDPSYWCGTSAHFYINPPGTSCDEACIWGTSANPVGNWAPYVAGANTDSSGNTFVKLAWNPVYLEPATPFRNNMPTWGVEIVCNGGGCNGLPCAIDPSKNGVNEITGSSTSGAGGGAFCVVTVPKGSTANFVVFDGSSGNGKSGGSSSSKPSSSSPSPTPSSSNYVAPSSSSSSYSWSSSSSSSHYSAQKAYASTSVDATSRPPPVPTYAPHVFVENSTATYTAGSVSPSIAQTQAPAQVTKKGAASATKMSILSLTLSLLIVTVTISF